MTPQALLSAVIAFVAVVAVGALLRRRGAPRPATAGGTAWREPEDRASGFASRVMAHRLEMAGFERADAAANFLYGRAGCAAACAALGAWIGGTQFGEQGPVLFATLAGAFLGWQAPSVWLEARIARRRIEIRSDFPVMLDLLQICMQGGMGLHAAWNAAQDSLRGAGDPIAREMRRVDIAIGLGQPWSMALAEAAERTGVLEFRSLGSLLGQTQRFGTGVADMIRVLCDSLRHDEAQGLEEQAHRRSVRMLAVLAGMLLPATLLIVVAPLLLMLFQALEQVTSD